MRRRQRERERQRSNRLTQEPMVKISKTTTLHVNHAFLYISLPSQHDYDVVGGISPYITFSSTPRARSLPWFSFNCPNEPKIFEKRILDTNLKSQAQLNA